jgi:UMF1 family MFS transporter
MKKEATPLGRFSWALFDWANQPFFTVITTFIFGPYVAGTMIADPVAGQATWAATQWISGIAIAVLSPFLGAMADAGGRRKPYVFFFQILVVVGCVPLWWAYPGRPEIVWLIAGSVVIATIGAEMSIVFNNAQLPDIIGPERMGRLSGFAWGLGYVGGLIALALVLVAQAILGPDDSHAIERATGPASALWLVVFVVPMFLFTPDGGKARPLSLWQCARQGGAALLVTLRELSHHRNAFLYLVAFMLYNDGLAAIIAFGGVYAKATFGWNITTLGIFGIIVTLLAIPGAIFGGRLDDALGSIRTVRLAIGGVIVATVGILGTTADRVLYVVPADPISPTRGLFGSTQELAFMAFALLLGLCMGPMQAASRTLIGRLAPPGMTGEFYGLFALSGRATAWMAPLAIDIVTRQMQSTRGGIACVLVFLVLGFALLGRVREVREPSSSL